MGWHVADEFQHRGGDGGAELTSETRTMKHVENDHMTSGNGYLPLSSAFG